MSETLHNRPQLQAVVFDLDDTLYAERDYVRSGYRAVGRHLADRTGRSEDFGGWLWNQFCQGPERQSRRFDDLNEAFALGLTADDILQLVRIYREHPPAIQPDIEAIAALQALAGRVKLGLLSDGYLPAQRLKLEALGLAGLFEAIVFTEQLGRECWKPSPAGFERLAEELNVPHAACAYIGDNAAKDFVAPNALGWLTIQWRRPEQVHALRLVPEGGQPAAVADNAEALLALLEPLLP